MVFICYALLHSWEFIVCPDCILFLSINNNNEKLCNEYVIFALPDQNSLKSYFMVLAMSVSCCYDYLHLSNPLVTLCAAALLNNMSDVRVISLEYPSSLEVQR